MGRLNAAPARSREAEFADVPIFAARPQDVSVKWRRFGESGKGLRLEAETRVGAVTLPRRGREPGQSSVAAS